MRDDDFFWEGAREGRLLVQACGACGLIRHPPSPICGNCQSFSTNILECSGKATLLGWLVSRHPTNLDENPRIVARLALAEGVFLISNLHGVEIAGLQVGQEMAVFFQEIDGRMLPQFRPADKAAA